ncbi:HAD family hydrolase [Paenibacillus campi]|uniref:D-glycero-alpha-D-manno-heptose-1,7-bisphosphate 7-phosphatase n=1 Tax=Paenibacillus campi TaxID=3106031 RepID=UPI002AFEC8FF|nr:HAD family hydrolase [Paenibacillus sp. SGZ-1014]
MRKALFLDRDGVINVEKNYLYKIDEFEFVDRIFEVMKFFQQRDYLIIVITNQAGIGRGYYSEHDFKVLNDWMMEQLQQQGITVTAVYYCPYHPTHGIGKYKQDSDCRKPNPGMILTAAREHGIDLQHSVLIGDKESDIQAGENAGIAKNLLIACNQPIDLAHSFFAEL